MAVGTLIPFSFVFAAVYWKILAVVLAEYGRHPIGIGGMAFYTVLGETGNRMLGIYGSFVVVFMAGYTIGSGV